MLFKNMDEDVCGYGQIYGANLTIPTNTFIHIFEKRCILIAMVARCI